MKLHSSELVGKFDVGFVAFVAVRVDGMLAIKNCIKTFSNLYANAYSTDNDNEEFRSCMGIQGKYLLLLSVKYLTISKKANFKKIEKREDPTCIACICAFCATIASSI